MKNNIALLVVLIMLFGGTTVFAVDGDTPSNWAQEEVRRGIEVGIVPERLQSKYQTPITREEFAELIVNAVFANAKWKIGENSWTAEKLLDAVTLEVEFEDAKQDHVKLAFILGSINGVSDTKFAPNNLITRQEAATMLVNTSHTSAFNYTPESTLGYTDFDTVADWAKPAVQASWSQGVMRGEGTTFNPVGNITREQAIATAIRLYERNHVFTLRGNLPVYAQYHELKYTVGKQHIIVDYEDDGEETALDTDMLIAWNSNRTIGDRLEYVDTERAAAVFAFNAVLMPETLGLGAVEPTAFGKSTKWDYGYMTVSFLDEDGLIRFEYKDIPGYMTQVNGYKYGYPFKEVEVNQIIK